jgi:hypothetical protein
MCLMSRNEMKSRNELANNLMDDLMIIAAP